MKWVAVMAAAMAISSAASGQTLKLMDLKEVDPAMLKDIYGAWELQDAKGSKRCRVVLKSDSTIGGSQIDVAKDCARTFPVMDEITAWRLYEGWTIGFADATRKLRIQFSTPDNRYVAEPETDGIFTIVKK
ncbi:AprI/Inh family metalloprotease inhibitor [Tardiphaga sp. 709]|uniref:AprI/Inh family metalloprotease inhibitor n=1 Tax=Tardiphaga sp. 709 TaxID=3076039 RepID=UPI0028E2DE57|nr:AprI/Inh family metalloprotease inhibitor [Tardiphaga sp. 709]WNV10552.1 AprI/Inh family metalloprotease inhibitor [Tardiphaga sp. 709]